MFPTTRRSILNALGSGDASERARAMDSLVNLYWKPLYKYLRVGWKRTPEDAEDLTQSFFARVLEKDSLASFDPAKARFRTFVRTLLDRHVTNERRFVERIKRGGGDVHLDFDAAEAEIGRDDPRVVTPEEYFQREWVRSVFAMAVERLSSDLAASNRATHFALFEAYDLDDGEKISYRQLGERHGLSETTVTNHLAAARRQFRAIVLDILRDVTASDQEFRAEARALLGGEP
ncbi:MAG TPA: sigma-70 family RNA polymerase sigma factor [Thermoanaerobaculia bacterium]|nr:sigma-70 family RNA polymerase sigma factor [Thermoanaerobaculia bacterium]